MLGESQEFNEADQLMIMLYGNNVEDASNLL
jgi:hypothetical protein